MALPDPKDFLPLKPVDLLILTMLSRGERHGYALRQDIIEQTEGRVELEAGNLYRRVRRLEADGLIGETDPPSEPSTDERRIYYELLPLGRRVLDAEVARLRELMRVAESATDPSPARS